jgi:hypothetical protein
VDLSFARLYHLGYRALVAGYFFVCGVLFVGGVIEGRGEPAALGGLGVLGLVLTQLTRRRWRRLQRALAVGDAAAAEQLWVKLWAGLDGHERKRVDLVYVHGCVLACGQRWAEAQELLTRLTRAGVPKSVQLPAQMLSLRCQVELDRAETVLGQAAELLATRLPARMRTNVEYVVAIAQLRLRRFESALATLERVRARLTHEAWRGGWNLHRGDALQALGREAEAREAFALAAQLAPRSYIAEAARTRLGRGAPNIYR